MALNPKLANAAVNAAADAAAALFNSGKLRIYDGTQAATADTAIGAQVKLAELVFNATAFGSAVAGVLTANAITQDSSADATGTASWFRCTKSDGTTGLLDGSVGTATADMIVPTTAIVAAAVITCSAFTLTFQKS